ncbi:MAG TPA: hypothetical protein VHA05_01440 [Candidatus Saccharimonadales bacterium]|jgi:hypothetical protein|nr:hypothetical protein [Candidatus Saccharimonadales bacterium]
MNQEELDQIQRHRQHGADIAADQGRAETGNRLWRTIPYAAGLLLATAVIYLGANAAGNEEDHAPQPPAALAAKLHHPDDLPPTTP